jgi:aromatic-L-amino-acid decarboxylase
MLSTGLGVIGLAWQSSPALTEIEEVTVDWVRRMVGLSDAWQGVIQDTASTSTMVALISARERATRYGAARGGLQSESRNLCVYASAQGHSSVDKAAAMAGYGHDNVRVIPTDENFAARADALEALIQKDIADGNLPCAVVATTGTTGTTALDPIEAMARIAKKYNVWLHVDAAMAGSAMICEEYRWMWRGIEGADSLVWNAHKWLGVAFDCSLYFVRDPQHLIRVMSTNPSYLQSAADGQVKNYRDWGIPLGRRFRALKLWFYLRNEGVERLQARIRRDIQNAQWLAEQIRNTSHWRVIAPTPLQTVCVRHEPPALSGEALDVHTRAWCDRIMKSGAAYLTPAVVDGRWMVRIAIGALLTEREHVEKLWSVMQAAVDAN